MSGNNIVFLSENLFELIPGEYITQIGDGRENGTIRTDVFSQPIQYVGSIVCQFKEKEKMYAFKFHDKIDNEDTFLLYGKTESEIFTEAVVAFKDRVTGKTSSYMRFYKPYFVKINPNTKQDDSN